MTENKQTRTRNEMLNAPGQGNNQYPGNDALRHLTAGAPHVMHNKLCSYCQ